MIKAILFDVGGVLISLKDPPNYERLAKYLKIDKEKFTHFWKKHVKYLHNGTITSKKFSEMIKKEFHVDKEILPMWKKLCIEERTTNKEVLNLAFKLQKDYKIGIISNMIDSYYNINKDFLHFDKFDCLIVSFKVKLLKPNKEIYELALKKLKLKASECVFIDDLERNLITAKDTGFKTILFKNNKQLKTDFKKLGIKF